MAGRGETRPVLDQCALNMMLEYMIVEKKRWATARSLRLSK